MSISPSMVSETCLCVLFLCLKYLYLSFTSVPNKLAEYLLNLLPVMSQTVWGKAVTRPCPTSQSSELFQGLVFFGWESYSLFVRFDLFINMWEEDRVVKKNSKQTKKLESEFQRQNGVGSPAPFKRVPYFQLNSSKAHTLFLSDFQIQSKTVFQTWVSIYCSLPSLNFPFASTKI